YSTAAEGSLVFNRIWQLRLADGTPITREIGEAYFVVLDEGRTKLKLSLGNGLTCFGRDRRDPPAIEGFQEIAHSFVNSGRAVPTGVARLLYF
ncbi:hypothetical protein, partial [Sphingomonas sp. Ag1]|uniref:hypothetical protein n=1 Tax=Sphingomonas sp. Ag1 TaxID=1642949 RepID=UPI000AECA751